MRAHAIALAAALPLAGCQTAAVPPDTDPAGEWGKASSVRAPARADADTGARMARWEQEWQARREAVAVARDDAVAAGATVPPELDREVTALLDREVETDQDDAARIEELQDAVSDALRLAELLRSG